MAAVDPQIADQIRQWVLDKEAERISSASAGGNAPGLASGGSLETGVATKTRGDAGPRVVAIEDASGQSYGARVTGDGNVGVETRPGKIEAFTTTAGVGTSSELLVDERAGRIQVTIQNIDDAEDLHIHLGDTATTSDLKIGPGEMFSLPAGIAFEGAIHGIATDAATPVVVIEYALT